MDKKKGQSNKSRPQLPSEAKPSEILNREELVHEDKDPIYPFEPLKDERKQGPGSGSKDKSKKKDSF